MLYVVIVLLTRLSAENIIKNLYRLFLINLNADKEGEEVIRDKQNCQCRDCLMFFFWGGEKLKLFIYIITVDVLIMIYNC